MKRKSILILAALVLAVSIPVFAFAETETALQPLDGTGFMYGRSQTAGTTTAVRGTRIQLQDCDLEDCDCIAEGTGIGNDGEALHQYAAYGSGMMRNGAAVDNTQTLNQNSTVTNSRGGRGSSRWN